MTTRTDTSKAKLQSGIAAMLAGGLFASVLFATPTAVAARVRNQHYDNQYYSGQRDTYPGLASGAGFGSATTGEYPSLSKLFPSGDD